MTTRPRPIVRSHRRVAAVDTVTSATSTAPVASVAAGVVAVGVVVGAVLVPAAILVPVAFVLAVVGLIVTVARWSARDGFSVREHRPDDPQDLLSARLVGFRD